MVVVEAPLQCAALAAAKTHACFGAPCMQAKSQADRNELLIWAAARGLLADVSAFHGESTWKQPTAGTIQLDASAACRLLLILLS